MGWTDCGVICDGNYNLIGLFSEHRDMGIGTVDIVGDFLRSNNMVGEGILRVFGCDGHCTAKKRRSGPVTHRA